MAARSNPRLERRIGRREQMLVRPHAGLHRIEALGVLDLLLRRSGRVDHTPLDAARSPHRRANVDDDAERIVRPPRRYRDARRRKAVPLDERLEPRVEAGEVARDELAVGREIEIAEQLVGIERRAVEVRADVVDHLARGDDDRDADPGALGLQLGARVREGAGREDLLHRSANELMREDVTGLQDADRRDLHVGPERALLRRDHDVDAEDDLVEVGREVRTALENGRRVREGRHRRGREDEDLVRAVGPGW